MLFCFMFDAVQNFLLVSEEKNSGSKIFKKRDLFLFLIFKLFFI
jgi:hypothetical protein